MWDVLIVGAGPASTATAIQCIKAGLKVAILESRLFPRHRPGESLHPGIEPLLESLGVIDQFRQANFLRYEGIWVKLNDEQKHFVPFGSDEKGIWFGFQAWRETFDEILLQQAKALGVEIIQPCRALRPLINGKQVVGVTTTKGNYLARFVVDGAGGQHWLAKQLGLEVRFFSPRFIAYYGYVEGNSLTFHENPTFIADEQGWTWIAKIKPNLYQWTRLNFYLQRLTSDWKPQEFQAMSTKYKTLAVDVTWRLVSSFAGQGFFLVGDAAGVLDPASSHGVLRAIMSGMMVAHLIVQSINQDSKQFIEIYQKWLAKWFDHDLEELNEIYRRINLHF